MADDNALDLSIGFQMGVTYRKLSNYLLFRLKEHEITPEQWSVLYQVDREDGLMQKEIAERSGKDRPTITRILDHLEGKGYVLKKIGDNDRRSFLVFMTEKGKALIAQTLPIEQNVIQEIKGCMSDEEYAQLMKLLHRINHHVNELMPR
ncbi:MarR family winged helix-turn-helix transcriptional regulator [Paenibacillus whitsoniae]|uniref:MarR family transcriptional regulator n=1 Tax=Paenibacillus whitsoniae TaxID=2496558 RepID=A0A430J611_9BACL|nr:MarR family transcriptional regulator [Paenibacillus whitsoniae]RTE03939.1 MarR family transcriptional regulator [Paenibacillus whitsoniae]